MIICQPQEAALLLVLAIHQCLSISPLPPHYVPPYSTAPGGRYSTATGRRSPSGQPQSEGRFLCKTIYCHTNNNLQSLNSISSYRSYNMFICPDKP